MLPACPPSPRYNGAPRLPTPAFTLGMPAAMTDPATDGWGVWLSTRFSAAETALSTIFAAPPDSAPTDRMSESTSALLSSPPPTTHLPRAPSMPQLRRRRSLRPSDDDVLPPLTEDLVDATAASNVDVSFTHAWGAVRRAAAATIAGFDAEPDDENLPGNTTTPQSRDITDGEVSKSISFATSPTKITSQQKSTGSSPSRQLSELRKPAGKSTSFRQPVKTQTATPTKPHSLQKPSTPNNSKRPEVTHMKSAITQALPLSADRSSPGYKGAASSSALPSKPAEQTMSSSMRDQVLKTTSLVSPIDKSNGKNIIHPETAKGMVDSKAQETAAPKLSDMPKPTRRPASMGPLASKQMLQSKSTTTLQNASDIGRTNSSKTDASNNSEHTQRECSVESKESYQPLLRDRSPLSSIKSDQDDEEKVDKVKQPMNVSPVPIATPTSPPSPPKRRKSGIRLPRAVTLPNKIGAIIRGRSDDGGTISDVTPSSSQDCNTRRARGASGSVPTKLSAERARELQKSLSETFAKNGGADVVARIKQLGDAALATMRDTTTLDARMAAELVACKRAVDDALRRLEGAMRGSGATRARARRAAAAAAAAARGVAQDGLGEAGVSDAARLLAVFAARTCADVFDCVEGRERRAWERRVGKVAEIASGGVWQLRAIADEFVRVVRRRGEDEIVLDEEEKCKRTAEIVCVKEAATGHVVEGVALGIAALQVEAAEVAFSRHSRSGRGRK